MKPFTYLLALALACSFIACKPKEDYKHELAEVINMAKLKETAFVPTLESPIEENKNIIYAPTLLFAWGKIKDTLNAPIKVSDNNSIDFRLMNSSTTHLESLTPSEYTATADVIDGRIVARAFFNKTLPFEVKLQRLENVIPFDREIVTTFGMQQYDPEIAKYAEILYYHDDDHFVFKLTPKDPLHEIIFAKGLNGISTLSDVIRKTNELIQRGKGERTQPNQAWRYSINYNDKFTIPVLKFNIETNLSNIEGQSFSVAGVHLFVDQAYQRTALTLDEYGAIVESIDTIAVSVDTAFVPVPEYPKNMLLNKTFYIIIKRIDKTNPYFVMKVENSELLIKSE